MAISFTEKTASYDNVDRAAYTTASVTPASNKCLVIDIEVSGTDPVVTAVAFTGGGTASFAKEKEDNGTGRAVSRWRYQNATPNSASTITITVSGTVNGCGWSVTEIDGHDLTGTNGSGAFIQSTSSSGSGGSGGAANLAAFNNPDSRPFAFIGIGANTAITAELTGGTNSLGASPNTSLRTQWSTSTQDTSPLFSWTGASNWRAISSEIKAYVNVVTPASYVDLPTLKLTVGFGGVSRTLGQTGARMANVRWSSSMPGGFDAFTCLIDDSERANNPNVYKYGARVTLTSDSGGSSGQTLWQGYLKTPTKNVNGTCTLTAKGWVGLLAERDDPRLWWTYDGWADMDSAPFEGTFNNSDNIDASASDRVSEFKVSKGTEIVPGDTSRVGWWFQDHTVSKVAWSQTTNRANPVAGGVYDYSLRLERYADASTGQNGAVLLATDPSPTAAATADSKSISLGAPQPMVAFRFRFEGTAKKDVQYDYKVRLGQLRVFDITTSDTYEAHKVVKDICGTNGVKFDNTTMVNTSSNDAMPYWHTDGPWTQIMEDMAANEGGWKWGVWEFGTGGPMVEFRPWSSGNAWRAYAYGGGASSQWAIPDINPSDDVYSQVRVLYHIAGHDRVRTITKNTSQSALLGLDPPRIRTFEHVMRNGQKNATQPTALATRMASEFGTTQYAGSLYLSYATDVSSSNDKTAYLIRAGDTIVIPDFPLGSTTFRIVSTECDEKGVTLGLGRRHIRWHKRRKNKHHRWGDWDHGRI